VNNPYAFSFIIAYRHRADRLQNLKRVLDWISGFVGVEIIIVEQDTTPKLQDLTLKGLKYIFTESKTPFNKAWSFNLGLKLATTNVIVFGDCDLIMDPNKFIESLRMLDTYECVSPYSRVIDLLPNEIHLPLEQLQLINRPGRGETDIQKICLSGGIIMYRRASIIRIGGWCEDFIGWGGEDDYQSFKSKAFLNWFENTGTCFHLWHERGAPDPGPYHRNLELLNKLIVLPNQETEKLINASLPKIGLKNKYA
jgi:hypothetical protein